MDALYCGQHDARDRFYCTTHREYDHCEVSGRSVLSEDEERALMDELLTASAGSPVPDWRQARTWEECLAVYRRRYVSP